MEDLVARVVRFVLQQPEVKAYLARFEPQRIEPKVEESELLDAKGVAQVLGCGRSQAYELMKRKGFPVVRIGRKVRCPRSKLMAWINSGGTV